MEAPKREKEKDSLPLGLPGSSAERFGGEMSKRQRLGLTLCGFPLPNKTVEPDPWGLTDKNGRP